MRVPSESEIGTVDLVIDTVDGWLANEGRGASAELQIGESVYVLDGSAHVKASRSALAILGSLVSAGDSVLSEAR